MPKQPLKLVKKWGAEPKPSELLPSHLPTSSIQFKVKNQRLLPETPTAMCILHGLNSVKCWALWPSSNEALKYVVNSKLMNCLIENSGNGALKRKELGFPN